MDRNDSQSTSAQLRDELKSLADTLDEILHSSADRTPEELDKIKSKAEDMLKETRERLNQTGKHIIDQTKEIAGCADGYVHKNPWTCVGISAAVGLVVGALIARR